MKIKRNVCQLFIWIFFLVLVGSQQMSATSVEEWLIKEPKSQRKWQEKKIRIQENVYPGMVLSQQKLRIKNESEQKLKLLLSVHKKSDEMDWLLSEVFFSNNHQKIKTNLQINGMDKKTLKFSLNNGEEATLEIFHTVNGELAQNRHQGQQFQFYWELISVAEYSQNLPHTGERVELSEIFLLVMCICIGNLLWRRLVGRSIRECKAKKT